MKKLIAVFAVLLLAAPALAADWSFYGSQRIATFYIADDFGDSTVAGDDSDWGLRWDFQGNSRLGARVKEGNVGGHIELAMRATGGGDGGDEGEEREHERRVEEVRHALDVGEEYEQSDHDQDGRLHDAAQ